MPDDTLNSPTDGTSIITKRGYSIWSLMVIMTLLGVWMAVPRHFSRWTIAGLDPTFFSMCCTLCHLAALWLLLGTLLWLMAGKRRIVVYLGAVAAMLFWAPITFAFIEGLFTDAGDHPRLRAVMSTFGIYKGYLDFYDGLYGWLGYEPI